MSITKRPPSRSADAFIAGAPDASAVAPAAAGRTGKPGRPVKAVKPVQITLSLPVDLLQAVDSAANDLSLSRAGYIKQALAKSVQG